MSTQKSADSEIRTDPLTGESVIFAKHRAARPNDFLPPPIRHGHTNCPFCLGNEHETPAAVWTVGDNDGGTKPNWLVRVVPNKYPALTPSESSGRPKIGWQQSSAGVGIHEVIIESPDHITSLSNVLPQQARLIFRAYRDRIAAASTSVGIRFAQLFKNVGPGAGASLEHIHSQLIAMQSTPVAVQHLLDLAKRFQDSHDRCYYCELLDRETRDGARIVRETERFVALCPFASRCPYETWIFPREHAARFEGSGDEMLDELAGLTRNVVQRIEKKLARPPHNLLLRTLPFDMASEDYYHWHIEILPRVAHTAGFEWATGCFINATFPEQAAHDLKSFG